jgi:hypothetical protein
MGFDRAKGRLGKGAVVLLHVHVRRWGAHVFKHKLIASFPETGTETETGDSVLNTERKGKAWAYVSPRA